MVRTEEEILNMIKERYKDDTSDDTLHFIEDVTDTFGDYNKRLAESGDWEQKYKENDAEWREKYKERFFSKPVEGDEPKVPESEPENPAPTTFEELFETEGE